MEIQLEKKHTHDLFATPLLQQTAFWSDVKESLGYQGIAYNLKVRERELRQLKLSASSYLIDDMLILSRPISRTQSVAYVPYGPLLAPDQELRGEFIEELSEQLRETLPQSTILIRYDLPWKAREYGEESNPAMDELRLNFGTGRHNIRRCATDMLPTYTTIINLAGSEEEILERMRPKTRYNIRLGLRKGVTVREGTRNDLPVFLSLYEETANRNGIRNHDSQFFQALYLAKEDDATFRLLIAYLDGVPLSAMFLTVSDLRATYLYGASSNRNRESMSTYALQWEAIRVAKQLGALEYDMFGIGPKDDPEHPLSGLSRFKVGFGGDCFMRMGCWDYPLQQDAANQFFLQESGWQSYHIS